MATTEAPTQHTTKKGRSPSYPSIPLDAAVKRAAALYEVEGRNSAPVKAIQQHWGYKPNTGPANLTIAALKKYGLLSDSGSGANRMAKLTDLGFEVVRNPDPFARDKALRHAALMPPVHRAVWEQYRESGLPSDATLRYELIQNRAFTETGATEFIAQFRKTVAFANLDSTATVDSSDVADDSDDEQWRGDDHGREDPPARRRRDDRGKAGMLSIPVPVIGGKPVTIEGQFPITEAAWDQFLAVLQAMKPGLVSRDDDELE